MDDLLKNCIEALNKDVEILNSVESDKINSYFLKNISFIYGRVNWSEYPNHVIPNEIDDILKRVKQNKCYIIWSDYNLPIVLSNLELILENYAAITDVSFDTWIVSVDFDWILEENFSKGTTFATIGKCCELGV